MTEDEIIDVADIVLLNFHPNDPRDWTKDDLKFWLNEVNQANKFDNLISDDTDKTFGKVHGFLIKEGYMERVYADKEIKKLTTEGVKAKQLKGIRNYVRWKTQDDRKKKIIEWPQKNWYWIAIITFTVALISDLAKELLSKSKVTTIIVMPEYCTSNCR